MTYLLESYKLLERMSKRFKIELNDNAKTTDDNNQRVASIANNIRPTKNAMKVNELVKDIQRTGSISASTAVDEVKQLQKFLSTYL